MVAAALREAGARGLDEVDLCARTALPELLVGEALDQLQRTGAVGVRRTASGYVRFVVR